MPMSYRAAQTLIKRGDAPALEQALEQGLDPNARNENGWTLLMLAAVEGSMPLAELLLARGADAASKNQKSDTALTIAEHRGYAALAERLRS